MISIGEESSSNDDQKIFFGNDLLSEITHKWIAYKLFDLFGLYGKLIAILFRSSSLRACLWHIRSEDEQIGRNHSIHTQTLPALISYGYSSWARLACRRFILFV